MCIRVGRTQTVMVFFFPRGTWLISLQIQSKSVPVLPGSFTERHHALKLHFAYYGIVSAPCLVVHTLVSAFSSHYLFALLPLLVNTLFCFDRLNGCYCGKARKLINSPKRSMLLTLCLVCNFPPWSFIARTKKVGREGCLLIYQLLEETQRGRDVMCFTFWLIGGRLVGRGNAWGILIYSTGVSAPHVQ